MSRLLRHPHHSRIAACGSVPSDRAILQPAATVGARRRSVFDRTCALILTASFATSVLPDQAPGAVTVVDESLCRPSVLRAVPRRPVVHETRAPCRPPGRRPLRPLRDARARREGLLRPLRRRPEQAAAALPGGEAGAHHRRYAERRAGRLHNLRQSGPRGGRVRGLPRRRARPLRRPPGRRGLRQIPDTHLRRRGLLCWKMPRTSSTSATTGTRHSVAAVGIRATSAAAPHIGRTSRPARPLQQQSGT